MSRIAIVCVDDEEIILSSLEKQLKRNLGRDYDIELVSNADAALMLCRELEAEGTPVGLAVLKHFWIKNYLKRIYSNAFTSIWCFS